MSIVKLSVIIPVYCVEHTLSRCVESVLEQCESMEVILVDDGSPDGSPALCDEWAERDSRVKVIHKENGGLSDARNAGIAVASGDYLSFVDSDDALQTGTLHEALRFAIDNSCDVVEFPVVEGVGGSHEEVLSFKDEVCELSAPEDVRHYWLSHSVYQHSYACNKLYARRLYDNICFPIKRSYEDLWTMPEVLLNAKRIGTISRGAYYYYYNDKGICRSGKYEFMRLESLLHACRVLSVQKNDIEAFGMFVEMLNCQITAFASDGKINKEVTEFIHHLPISYGRNMKERIKIMILRIAGLRNMCRLMTFLG